MRKIILLHIILLFSLAAWSQNPATDFPYECSFEEGDPTLGAWVLNYNSPTATDQWMFGTAVHSEGRRSMYISSDGTNPLFGQSRNIVVAYLRYRMPVATSTQKYDVSFDWKGVGDSTTSKLYLFCGPESMFLTDHSTGNYFDVDKIVSTTSGNLSPSVINHNSCQPLGESGEKFVCGSEAWQNVSLTNPLSVGRNLSGQVYAFVFVWVNNKTEEHQLTSIAIDNFQINTASIEKPKNVVIYPHCEDSTLLVTWESGLPEFDIQWRKVGETSWTHGVSGVTQGAGGFSREDASHCTYSIKRILEGSYDVRLRGKYTDDESVMWTNYIYTSNILVYCPDNHCVNYVDLYSPTVTCTYGHYPGYHTGSTPYDNIGIIDYGPDARESRHTLHIDPSELDPRTDSMLHTVPDGALASVRLGNWATSGEAESVTYEITVDSAHQGILIVKYAVVFENPSNHLNEEEPAFVLDVLDENGQTIDLTCGHAEFTYSTGANSGWNLTSNNQVAWKDWTTIGVNLMPYDGQTIKVRFTTMDCGQGGHYAYAYFTVDCANAHIETENCGNDASVTCVAPEGFAYEWADETGLVVSHEREFIADAGAHTYTCTVSFIEQPDCNFQVSTFSAPRFPVPEYTFERVYENCSSSLEFINTSHVMNKFEGYENHTAEPCNEGQWFFRSLSSGRTKSSTAWNATYACPDMGDSIEVTYTAYIGANNACDSTRVDTIVVPNIVPEPTEFHFTSCSENPVKFNDQWFDRDTMYVGHFPNFAGCDSVSTLFLKVYPKPQDQHRHDSICSDQSLTIAGVKYTQPLDNYLIMLKNENGCDSAIYLTLTVNERLKATIDSVPYSCADEGQMYIWMDIAAGVYDSLVIKFNTPELRDTVIYEQVTSVAIPYPETIKPGHYSADLTFYQFCCGQYAETRGFDIRYPSAIVEQKWNDVLTLLSPKYNGGYDFLTFQWYKNGMPILGENHSYLYQPLDFDAEYYVELMRKDSVVMTTCPIQPVYHEQQTAYPTIVQAGQHMPMYMEHAVTIWYYTISGQLYSTFALPQGYTSLPAPDQTGTYIIKSVDSEGETQAQVMIVE